MKFSCTSLHPTVLSMSFYVWLSRTLVGISFHGVIPSTYPKWKDTTSELLLRIYSLFLEFPALYNIKKELFSTVLREYNMLLALKRWYHTQRIFIKSNPKWGITSWLSYLEEHELWDIRWKGMNVCFKYRKESLQKS